MEIKMLDNEYWWVGSVIMGHEMPLNKDSEFDIDFVTVGDIGDDQYAPLMLSSKGRYIWSDHCFSGKVKDGIIKLEGKDIILEEGYENLKGAYLDAMKKHFPFSGKMPNELFWTVPQYNTWMEVGFNQTSDKIINYAKSIVDNGLPAGILMIDGGWQEDYGMFEFNLRKIPDPKRMMDELHQLGFKVMVWVSPIVASAGKNFCTLRDKNYLIKNADGTPAIRKWWSGYSAVLDFTNPEAVEWYHSQLKSLMDRYGIDGFKFDAGDPYFYEDDDITYESIEGREHTKVFNSVGEVYEFNEFRAAWNYGGKAIVSRLQDKSHRWNRFGLNTLIPHTIMQGLCGYAYGCPDMVGGGSIGSFERDGIDQELFVRWAQANSLMGMLQMSASPWNLLDEENTNRVKASLKLKGQYGSFIYELAKNSAATGEPIVRHMAYEYPDCGYETNNKQFMLGSNILVSPVLEKGETVHEVTLPEGEWVSVDGKTYVGPSKISINVTIDDLPYFIKK